MPKPDCDLSACNTVRLFICGPTLYEKSHLGHARIFVFFNFLYSYYRFKDYLPFMLLQLTDIDPKIFEKSKTSADSSKRIIEHNLSELLDDLKALQVEKSFIITKVSDFIYQIKKSVCDISKGDRGYSYAGNIYLRINEKIGNDFSFSAKELSNMPIDISQGKESQLDIAIWNAESFLNDGVLASEKDSCLTSGIPGWHFQDFAVLDSVFQGKYEVHGGAKELIYPHHLFISSIARNLDQENCDKTRNKRWLHLGLVNVDRKKMSNSGNNAISISSMLKHNNPNVLKIFFLLVHYSRDMEFSQGNIDKAKDIDKTIIEFLLGSLNNEIESTDEEDKITMDFLTMLDKDYDTPSALKMIVSLTNKSQNRMLVIKLLRILGLVYY
jgi:cysteinyl-tRNA synthetase